MFCESIFNFCVVAGSRAIGETECWASGTSLKILLCFSQLATDKPGVVTSSLTDNLLTGGANAKRVANRSLKLQTKVRNSTLSSIQSTFHLQSILFGSLGHKY